jgi:hypothetical protein
MQITKETRLSLNKIILANRKIRANSTSFHILSSFYAGMKTAEIISKFSKKITSKYPRKDVCRYMTHLQSVGLLEKKSHAPPEYTITKKGRWYVIAAKLGIPLFSLILLANVYVFQKNVRKNSLDFYVVGFFFEKVKSFLTHTYRVHGELIRKNYVIKCANQTIRIPKYVLEQLEREFDADLNDIYNWYQSIDDDIDLALMRDRSLFHHSKNSMSIIP